MSKLKEVPLVFNLFPRHFPTIDDWGGIIPHIKDMGFNAVYVNPFHETGFSGSLYAVKDYYRLNRLFLKKGQEASDFTPLKKFIAQCRENDLNLIMDLVINHTAFDSDLTRIHPQWYKHDRDGKLMCPYAIDPADASKVTVWGDLAIIDNLNSTDRNGLWQYWDSLVKFYQEMGIFGYRCDAAYQVPAPLWEMIISSAKMRASQTLFFAETLGCQMAEIEALAHVGFDYLFNSSKWWNFDKPWALEQHALNKKIAPSISFAESHDTERLASEKPGSIDVQKGRYAFSALFSEGLLMPMGYEYGATTRIDVVKGTPSDVDKPVWDISGWIKQINRLKLEIPVLSEEGNWRILNDFRLPCLFLQKNSDCANPPVVVCVNKNQAAEIEVENWMIPSEVKKCTKAIGLLADTITEEPMPGEFLLDPADVVIFL